jgi:hypothetical protein
MGLVPALFWPVVARAMACWRPAWAVVEAPAPIGEARLGSCRAGHSGRRWRRPSGCGASARQRTAAGPDVGLRLRESRPHACNTPAPPLRHSRRLVRMDSATQSARMRRPRGHFPADAIRLERVPETGAGAHHRPGERDRHASVHRRCAGCSMAGCSSTSSMCSPDSSAWGSSCGWEARHESGTRKHPSTRACGWCSRRCLPGIINKVKAWVAGPRGPPVLQLYYDLAKLWRKGVVLSTLASPAFVAGPAVAWVALVGRRC